MISLRVLVLDDELPSRRITSEMLAKLGVRVVFQASGKEKAMSLVRGANGVDVVICNLNNRRVEYVDFMLSAGKERLINAVVVYAPQEPQLLRALESVRNFLSIKLVDILTTDTKSDDLGSILRDYNKRKTQSLHAASDSPSLPSEGEVREALVLKEFKAWFQPKFDLRTGALAGVEALVRWEHPSRGLLLPREFLSAVLAYDLIDEMFKQVFYQVLELQIYLRSRHVLLQVAINLHASQLVGVELVSFIEKELIESGLPGECLMFELAENGLLDMPVDTLKNLLCLRMLGCGLAIDDFGVGFSSLSLLCQLPFDQLKLDSSMVKDLSDHSSQAIVFSAIAVARSLEMALVIEGVSSQEILDRAIAMGGSLAQGFHLAKPMSVRRLKEWLE